MYGIVPYGKEKFEVQKDGFSVAIFWRQEDAEAFIEMHARLAAAEALAEACKIGTRYVGKYVADTDSAIGQRVLDQMNVALAVWEGKKGGNP